MRIAELKNAPFGACTKVLDCIGALQVERWVRSG